LRKYRYGSDAAISKSKNEQKYVLPRQSAVQLFDMSPPSKFVITTSDGAHPIRPEEAVCTFDILDAQPPINMETKDAPRIVAT